MAELEGGHKGGVFVFERRHGPDSSIVYMYDKVLYHTYKQGVLPTHGRAADEVFYPPPLPPKERIRRPAVHSPTLARG